MNLPMSECVRGGATLPRTGGATLPRLGLKPNFGMVPIEVLADEKLTHRDTRVYGILAAISRIGTANVGTRRIGKIAGIDRHDVRRSIDKLIECGHVGRISEERPRMRGIYKLLSPIFGSVPAESVAVPSSECPTVAKPKPVVCPKCNKVRHALLKIGICRSCNWHQRIDRIAERAAERVYDRREGAPPDLQKVANRVA